MRQGIVVRGKVATLPNLLSLSRILLIPLLVVLLMDPGRGASLLAAGTFFFACWSDFFDGYLARRHGIATPIGKLLDPLADKLIVMAALVMLAAMPRQPRVTAWIVVLVLGRELAVTGVRAIAVGGGYVLAADELGKYKMIFQMLALHGLLLHYPFWGVDWHTAGMYFLWVALAVGLWSGVDYHIRVVRHALLQQP
jgi:CDP-diacylglycerol---glycerol-3-phosphate 3-phosphatidyltransferase